MAIRVPPGGSSLGSFLFTTSALAFGGPRSKIVNGWEPDAPSGLDIDFTTGTLDPRITFARASTATYYNSSGLIASAASGAPRFDYDPATLTPRGLLLEEQRTNLLTYSNDFSNAAWVKAAGSSVVQDATGPDGVTNSAWSTTISPAGPGVFNYHAGANAGQPATQSIWLRAKSGTPQVYFEFGNSVGSTLLTLSTTWTRYTISDPVGHQYFELRTDAPASLPSVTIEMYGAQLEVGAFATSYIPTTSTAVTRAADTAEITGANFSSWYNASAGTFVAEYRPQSVSGTQPVISVNDTTANESIRLYGSGADPKAIIVDGGATQADLDAGTIAAANAAFYKLGLAFAVNDFAACFEGGTVATDAAGTLPTVVQLQFHTDIAGNVANLHIKRLQYFNTRKTDSELQALTAQPIAGTGALIAPAAVVASTTGVSGSTITDTTLNANSAALSSTTGVSASIGNAATEAQRTNLALWSGDIGNAVWAGFVNGTGSSSRTSNVGTAPDGTTTAGLATINRSAATDWAQGPTQSFTGTAAVYTGSIWLKAYQAADVGKQISLCLYDGTNVVGLIFVTLTANWVRYNTSATLAAAGCQIITGYVSTFSGGGSDLGQIQYLAWGGQVELGTPVSSYIPTTTAAVTRAATTSGLTAQAAAVSSTSGVSGSAITDTTLNASPAVVASTTGISGSLITDTTLNASPAVLSSTTGISGSLITDTTLNASAAVLSSTTGLIRAIGNASALTAQASTLIGIGAGSAAIGAGALSARPATLASTGLALTTGSGALVDAPAALSALAISGSAGVGSLNVTAADVEGLGYVEQGGVSIMVGGEWQRTTPYVRVGGTWKPATAWANVNGEWRRVA